MRRLPRRRELTDGILQSRLAGENQYEIGSTPTFVIDGKTYSGSRDVEGVRRADRPAAGSVLSASLSAPDARYGGSTGNAATKYAIRGVLTVPHG